MENGLQQNGSPLPMHNPLVFFPSLPVSRTAGYVSSVAHGLVLSGTTIAWYVTVVTSSRITYVLSAGSATTQNCRKTCFIVTCAKGKETVAPRVFRQLPRGIALGVYPRSQPSVPLSAAVGGMESPFPESERCEEVKG